MKTLKIKDVHLLADYAVTGGKDNNGAANFGSHIKIEFLLRVIWMEGYRNGYVITTSNTRNRGKEK
ncbi:TasA family protein [Paenisporosarcina sp. OV554]|uniref:TasA family protein n=1 Tax=Paenisporosarcina sp. OV554 TaxID=2135694 RepID=UPI000D3899E4